VAGQLGLDVVREVQGSAPFFAAAFILCHTALFAALGLPMALALGAAAVYAMGAAGGAPLGWWAAFYPSQVALGVAAGCGALGLNAVARSLRPGAVLVLAGSGLGLSALIHPFAWWGWGLVLVHAAILALASARRRDRLVPLALYAGPALILGLTAMLPLLLQGANPDGVQGEVAGVMMIGERMFTMDPLLVLRFGGGLGLLAAPLFLLATRARWRRDTGIWLGLAAALPVWTVAMNPLLQPLVFTQVGYLSERLGELAWIPALAFLPFFARASDGRPRFSSPSLLAGAAALAMLLGLPHALRAGTSSPYPSDLSLESLRDLDLELAQLEIDRVASDPGLSYLLRGVGGGYALIQPAEHCSPLDRGVEARLAAYRRLLSPRYPISALAEGLSRMGANGLIVDEAVENRYRFATHGFVPSNERQEALIRRLSEAGVEPDLRSGSFLIYSMPTLRAATAVGETRPESSPSCETTLVDPLVGGDFTVIGLDLAAEAVTRGDELKLRICYVEGGDPAAWDTVRLRLEGPMPHIPGWASGFSKIYRKIIVERSGRSRARFRDAWVPLDGYWLGAAEEGPIVGEWRSIAIPEDIAPGEYDLQLSVHNEAWRPVRRIADFLRDEDSWSAPAVAVVRIEEGEEE
jgi:hypothetical protein